MDADLARPRKDEDPETFWRRCRAMASPVWLVKTAFDSLKCHDDCMRDMNERDVERDNKIAALEARVTAIEDRGLEYRGVYQPEETYRRGDAVTSSGSLWIAKAIPTGKPGVDFDGWQLAVTRGRDGRSAR